MRRAIPSSAALALLCNLACNSAEVEPPPPLLEARAGAALTFGTPKDDCAECHPQHVAEWSISPHAYAARDPVFHAMVRMGQNQTKGKLGQFCIQCHSPPALALGTAPVYSDETGTFRQDTDRIPPLEREGVSCDVCHSITEVIQPVNARAVLTPNGVRRATIQDPVENSKHPSAYSPLHKESLLCGMCHAVTNPKQAKIEETFTEWQASSFAQPGGQTCQDCHMRTYEGQAAKDGPTRTVHRHTFVGVDISLLPPDEFPGYDELRTMTEELLRESAEVTVTPQPEQERLQVRIKNLTGHALPSGATAERQMWVELIVTTSSGAVVFESGTLDPLGDLRDPNPSHSTMPGTDPQLIYYGQQLLDDPRVDDPNATLPMKNVSMPWQANAARNFMIPVDSEDLRYFDLSALPAGNYDVSFRLMFRSFPQYFLRILEGAAGLDPAVKTRVPNMVMYQENLSYRAP